ncbi:hypothetical protein GCM10023238_03930 [Streptomyces heliomycini]
MGAADAARGRGARTARPRRTVHPHAADAEWLIERAEDGPSRRRGHAKAAVALRGPLTSVLLAFCRRLPPDAPRVEVVGRCRSGGRSGRRPAARPTTAMARPRRGDGPSVCP